MKHAALARGHRWEGVGPAACANLLDRRFRGEAEFPIPLCFETFSVKEDEVVFFGFEPKDLGGDVLDGVEKLTVAGKKEGSICAGKLDAD